MAYPKSLKQRAIQLANDGHSAKAIADIFSKEVAHGKHDYQPTERTIRNWLRQDKVTTFPKISVTMKDGRVESIRKDEQHDNWIGAYIKQHKKLPILPDFLLPVVNKYQKGQPISKDIEVIPASGQYWNQRLLNSQREQLLELVEWLGDTHYPTASDYVGLFESMYPRDPDFSKRWKPFEQH